MHLNILYSILIMNAERKVWENMDLVCKILSYIEQINGQCEICGKILKYQILDIKIKKLNMKVCSCEKCEKGIVCSEECLKEYEEENNNKKFCIIFICMNISIINMIVFVALILSG
jgi:hypothetical protein